jgi:dihydroorotase/N-acyl-D-amino-acid deacylase
MNHMRLLFTNGRMVDGTGSPARPAELLIDGARISGIAPSIDASSAQTVDCTGLVIAPGFIDAHSHSDLQILENLPDKTRQGVTSEVVGNCGFSAFPCGPYAAELREFANGIFCGDDTWGWPTAADYLAEIQRRAKLASAFPLTGHGSLRIAHAGLQQGPLESSLVDRMAAALDESLSGPNASDRSIGFSTGLMYAPGSSAPFDELVRLCSVVARRDAIYCTHMRSYAWQLLEAIDEQLDLARSAGCRLQISHLQTVGRENWPKQEQAFERIEAARHSGLDVEFDIYPYLAGSTVLTQLLPQAALDGGIEALLARLTNPVERRAIANETEASIERTWSDVLISGLQTPANQALVGLTIAEIAAQRAVEPIDAVIDLLIEEQAAVQMISFNQSEPNLRALLTHPLCTVISDGFYVKGRPHPRLYGTFPALLGRYCRELKWFTLEEAVHKITGKPARRFGLGGRGLLEPGAFADITVFNPETVGSPATYSHPDQPPTGIACVLREGRVVSGNLPC